MNYEGLKDDVIRMLGGERVHVDVSGFQNDLKDIWSKDDVLTVLIHLGYNNENSLACVLSIAYYYAKNDYVFRN